MAVPRLLARLPLPLLEICVFHREISKQKSKIDTRDDSRVMKSRLGFLISFFFFFLPTRKGENFGIVIDSYLDDHFSMKRAASGNCCTNSWTKIQQRTGGGWPGLRGFRTRFLFFLFYPNKTLLPYLSPSFCVS